MTGVKVSPRHLSTSGPFNVRENGRILLGKVAPLRNIGVLGRLPGGWLAGEPHLFNQSGGNLIMTGWSCSVNIVGALT